MQFDASRYGTSVANILALDGDGNRLMPLVIEKASSDDARRQLAATTASKLFPNSVHPDAALSGLWLYFSCFDESHSISQDLHTPEGSFWHGILHRQEPDEGNASYWFRRVGKHPTFPEIRDAASELGYPAGNSWNPFDFIEYVERARRRPGSEAEKIALAVQRAEWQILFDYCARTKA